MPAPELVVADAAYKTYPGGVLALRCSDWLAGARGTLSTEADARSATGTVVRDSQVVTNSIFTDPIDAFQEADDTLEIDLSTIPIEETLRYIALITTLIEGDWDTTNSDTLFGGTQELFAHACELGAYGDSTFFTSDSDFGTLSKKWRKIDQYRVGSMGGLWLLGDVDGTEVIHFRAYAQDGTTIEWLLDQIILIPYVTSGTHNGWQAGDFAIVGGQQGTFSGLYDIGAGDWVDGADGGDDFGKFTWHPVPTAGFEQTAVSGADGGGDYQRKSAYADAEYMARVVEEDFFYIANSVPSPDVESNTHGYGVHGPFHTTTQTWMDDDFSRTVGDGNFAGADGHFQTQNWGVSPDGFAWASDGLAGPASVPSGPHAGKRIGTTAYVDGSEGVFEVRGYSGSSSGAVQLFLFGTGGETGPNTDGAQVKTDNTILAGTFRLAQTGAFLAGGGNATMYFSTHLDTLTFNPSALSVHFDFETGVWNFYRGRGTQLLDGPNTLGGYTPGDAVRIKIEVRRYVARTKVWLASGSEPSAWDFEGFRPLFEGGISDDYDYGDDLNYSINENESHSTHLHMFLTGNTDPDIHGTIYTDDFTIDHDAGGAEESAFAAMEQPEGVKISEIELPAGCQHLVYWGTRDWTVDDGFGGYYLEFSSRVWNDTTAAELQRAEAIWWWFRSIHANIVPMNWRSADRAGATTRRMLVGTP